MTNLEKEEFSIQKQETLQKIDKIKECSRYLEKFKSYIDEEKWNARFDLPLEMFLEEVADTNMRIFMGMARGNDYKVEDPRAPRTKVRANPDTSNMV